MPLDWLSWESWVANRDNIVPIATFIVQLATLTGGAIGIYFLAIRTRAADRTALAALEQTRIAAERHDEQTKADQERRITESFAKAVEQLGNDKIEPRLGGIYTLERITQESERLYWPILEMLTAYVREHAPWPPQLENEPEQARFQVRPEIDIRDVFAIHKGGLHLGDEPQQTRVQIRPATDIQAVLTVLGRCDEMARQRDEVAGRRLDLAVTDLRGVDLKFAHLRGVDLPGAHLEGACLRGADLEGANLLQAHLTGADLSGARERTCDTLTSCGRT